MAQKDNAGSSAKQPLKQDSLVDELTQDARQQQPTIQVSGWLGRGGDEGKWNLFLTPKLDEYIQFSEQDVIHSQPLSVDFSPLGGTIVWLRAGTSVRHVTVATLDTQADFLAGSIASTYLAGALSSLPAVGSPRGAMAVGTAGVNCSANPHIPACAPPTQNCYQTKVYPCTIEPVNCGTNNAFCATREFVC
jgi:hypothetical protein